MKVGLGVCLAVPFVVDRIHRNTGCCDHQDLRVIEQAGSLVCTGHGCEESQSSRFLRQIARRFPVILT